MLSRRKFRIVRRFLGDTRGAEMLETVAKVAFIALPILAIFLYTMKTFNQKYKQTSGEVGSQSTNADSATKNALGGLNAVNTN